MKSKTYWGKYQQNSDPFQLSKRVARRIAEVSSQKTLDTPLQFLWIYVNEHGAPSTDSSGTEHILNLEEWLNVVDEAAALGANSIIVHVGDSFNAWPDVWNLCQWAQETHNLQVGLHYTGDAPSDDEIQHVANLVPSLTRVFLGSEEGSVRSSFETAGIQVAAAEVCKEDIDFPCHAPEHIACVDTAGKLYSCGLVLGDQRYGLGTAQEKTLASILDDDELPHSVAAPAERTTGQCDGCPSRLFNRLP